MCSSNGELVLAGVQIPELTRSEARTPEAGKGHSRGSPRLWSPVGVVVSSQRPTGRRSFAVLRVRVAPGDPSPPPRQYLLRTRLYGTPSTRPRLTRLGGERPSKGHDLPAPHRPLSTVRGTVLEKNWKETPVLVCRREGRPGGPDIKVPDAPPRPLRTGRRSIEISPYQTPHRSPTFYPTEPSASGPRSPVPVGSWGHQKGVPPVSGLGSSSWSSETTLTLPRPGTGLGTEVEPR